MKSVGINEIANKLNISRNTVSKVMNNRGSVSDKTRNRIIQTAIEMGYSKLPEEFICKDNYEEKMKNILVIATAPDFSAFWGEIIHGITQELGGKQYQCFYHFLTFEQEQNFLVPQLIERGEVAGIIVMNVYNIETIKSIRSLGLPTVYYDLPLTIDPREAQADVVVVEGRQSVCDMTLQLLKQGDTNLGFIGDASYCKSIAERWEGFVQAHKALHVPVNKAYCFTNEENGHFYFGKEVEEPLKTLIRNKQSLPDAFVCANDAIAYKIIKQLKSYGYKVPEDIRITGFDDIEVLEEKDLTSVGIDISDIGVKLAEQLIWRIQNPKRSYEMIKIYGEIYYRKSSQK